MKGLLIKDFYMAKKHCLPLFGIILLWIVISIFGKAINFLMFSVVLLSMIPINILAFDDYYKWNKCEVVMPVSRTTAVLEKYLFLLIIILPAMLIAFFALHFVFELNTEEAIGMISFMLLSGFAAPSVTLPLSFKLGYTKAKIASMVATGIMIFVMIAISNLFSEALAPGEMLDLTLDMNVFAIIAVVVLGISMLLSINFYKKREF